MIHPTDQFFEEIASEVIHGIENKNFEFIKIKNRITSRNYNLLGEFQRISQEFNAVSNIEGVKPYNKLFIVIKNILKNFIQQNHIDEKFLNSNEVIQAFIKHIVDLLILEKLCIECNSSNIYQTANPYNENETIYFCRNCQKKVKFIRNTQHVPLFLMYIDNWVLNGPPRNIKSKFVIKSDQNRLFLIYLFSNCLDYFKNDGEISSFIIFYKIFEKNNINHEIFEDQSLLKKRLLVKLKKSLKSENFYDFLEGKNFYIDLFGEIDEDLNSSFIDSIINSLKSGDILKIKFALENFKEDKYSDFFYLISDENIKVKIETNFYKGLSKCLELKRFENFRLMIESSIIFDIFIDIKKIKNRFKILSKLILDCHREVSLGYQTASLGKIIYYVKFFNEFNLLVKEFSNQELELLEEIKQDKLFLLNLNDLLGNFSDSTILYIAKVMPKDLYEYLMDRFYDISFGRNPDQMVQYVNVFFNRYSIYGLSVEKLGRVRHFIHNFKKIYLIEKKKLIEKGISSSDNELKYIEFNFKNKRHLVSPQNLLKNKEKISERTRFKFYNLSMVLLGGLGPQGHGFTYSTPKGEIIEICSDIRENNAIIVKYKQFLKIQFLTKLKIEMSNLGIKKEIIQKVELYLSEILNQKELINYYKKVPILNKIKSFLNEQENYQGELNQDREDLIEKISNAITIILRPIKMIDQFKARMDLVSEEKLKSEEIASLTSLKEKSHYDVLRERFFYQYIVKWFFERYISKNPIKSSS
jgi:hypothetical protein